MPDATKTDQIYALRLQERQLDYQTRRLQLALALEGIPPIEADPRVPNHGAAAWVEQIAGVAEAEVMPALEQVHTQGFAVSPLLNNNEIEQLSQLLGPIFERTTVPSAASAGLISGNPPTHIHNLLAKTDVLDPLVCHPTLRAIVSGILGYDFILNAGVMAMSPDPGSHAQGLHRDDSHYPLPRPHRPLVLTMALAIDAFTPNNGSTRLVPGSHRWEEEQQPEPSDIMTLEVPAGSVLMWDGAVFHGSGPNHSDQPRRAITLNYACGWLRSQHNHYLGVPRERIRQMPSSLQKDLGYLPSALGLGQCERMSGVDYLHALEQQGGDGQQAQLGQEHYPHANES